VAAQKLAEGRKGTRRLESTKTDAIISNMGYIGRRGERQIKVRLK
jgi:hypothetical protein